MAEGTEISADFQRGWTKGVQAMQLDLMTYIDFVIKLYNGFDTGSVEIEDVMKALRDKVATSPLPGLFTPNG